MAYLSQDCGWRARAKAVRGENRRESAVYVTVHEHLEVISDDGVARFGRPADEKVVGRLGIEPRTSRLKAECSTSELTPLPGVDGGEAVGMRAA